MKKKKLTKRFENKLKAIINDSMNHDMKMKKRGWVVEIEEDIFTVIIERGNTLKKED